MAAATLSIDEVGALSSRVLDEVERAIVGKRDALELILLGILGDGHVLLEDFPGLAKTLIARSFAQATTLGFSRIQFTPDLMPSDVTGSSIFNQRNSEFEFRPGPIFANILLSDEINRAPPKTQAALLEAMQERQVTIEGVTHPLERPFLVLATQNPIEYEGTYPLPEAQLDRFLIRLGIGYPEREDEWQVLVRRMEREMDEIELTPVVDGETLLRMQLALEQVHVSEQVGLYMVDIVTATRTSTRVQVGASPRGTLALLRLSRGRAALQGRDFVTPDDVKAVAVPALAHRVTLRPELWVQRVERRGSRARGARLGADAARRRVKADRPRPSWAPTRGWLLSASLPPWLSAGRSSRSWRLLSPSSSSPVSPRRASRSCSSGSSSTASAPSRGTSSRSRSTSGAHAGRAARAPRSPAGHVRARRGSDAADAAPGVGRGADDRAEGTLQPLGRVRHRRAARSAPTTASISSATRARSTGGRRCKVYPRAEQLRALVAPLETQVFTGNQVARAKGEGIEFADLRRYEYGDALRRINWRASARRNELWVNEMHPERNTDVIIFLDTFVEAREEKESTLDVAVRAAATLADRYLERKDRVGLISFGGYLNWLLPGSGLVQLYRIVDSLLDTEIILSYAWKGVDVIPARTLPPKALVLAISPLLDERALTTLLDLRARGFDLAVLEVSPAAFASPAEGEREQLAYRLWQLKREALRSRYRRVGIPVVEWREGTPLEGALAEVGAFRRQARVARA